MGITRGITSGITRKITRGVTELGYAIAPPLLLDVHPTTGAAYSLRKLRTEYFGNCFRVRRSSDSTEQDIGFSGRNLDTNSLLSFCGAGDGFVVTLYDQSGSDLHQTQSTTSAQPPIVTSGSLLTKNGKPAIVPNGSSHFLQSSSATWNTIADTGTTSLFFVMERTTETKAIGFSIGTSTVEQIDIVMGSGGVAANILVRASLKTFTFTGVSAGMTLYTAIDKASGESGSANGVSATTGTAGVNQACDRGTLFSRRTGSAFSRSAFQEWIIYSTDQTANKSAIEADINQYWGVY